MTGFEVHAGDGDSPVLLHVPHGSWEIPGDVRADIVLDDEALAAEARHITDAHTAEIAAYAALGARTAPWRFVNRLSRLVVDPERFPDEREEMAAVGMGAVYTRTTHREVLRPDGFDDGPLLERYFHPYAAAMTDAVAERLDAAGWAVVIDVHSYPTRPLPYELHGEGPRPPVCLGVDPFHTSPGLLARAERIFGRFGGTAVNSPFAGTYVPLKFYGREERVQALMIEIRRDLYMSEPGGPANEGVRELGEALGELVAELS
ncbi:N-formylglutamate amidohydrolase [Streptomyces sp. TRM66268-LWL]|uniref:N-formylglutamate amidohydrolase n=1 Tax=Streptomyces polyasparticus TaxID=2767826 RepID=A0ABR7SDK0_9ACTN|nr:N-formylglutamate amidohydrolase [Streptomyces polyasparticus]MBC9713571.1 N-formylglutamate amidohydrolase [Streptomyces polyasparticus]